MNAVDFSQLSLFSLLFLLAPIVASLPMLLLFQLCRRLLAHLELRDADALKPVSEQWRKTKQVLSNQQVALFAIIFALWVAGLSPLFAFGYGGLIERFGALLVCLGVVANLAVFIITALRLLYCQMDSTNLIVRRCVWNAM